MRHRPRPPMRASTAATLAPKALLARLPLWALGLACAIACAANACGGGRRDAKPVAMLASSPQSAAAFEGIREAFADPEHTTAAALRDRVERFLSQFPDDGLVPRARVI